MTDNVNPMDIDDDLLSETDTWIYDEQDLDSSGTFVGDLSPLQSYIRCSISEDEITDVNWRFAFGETLGKFKEHKFHDGARPLLFDGPCRLRLTTLPDASFSFPLSSPVCSRLICDHGTPLPLSNKYDFCGTKVR
jgi:hypothetical protein